MPERRLFPEFRDEYEPTRYPFADSSLLTPTRDEMQTIDQDMFLDASLYPIGAVGFLYIDRINIVHRAVTISIADQTLRSKASVVFDPLFAPEVLRVSDPYGRPAGVLVSDSLRLARFGSWSLGDHLYRPTATTFAVACAIPTPEVGVRGILTARDELLTRDVLIVGDNGVVVRQGSSPENIRVDIVGDPLYIRKLCGPADRFSTPLFIKTINGCSPDQQGNFNITVGDHFSETTILRVYPSGDGLVIEAVGQTVQRVN